MEIIKQIFEKWDLIALLVAVALGGLAQLFRWISTKTKATWDDELAQKLGSASEFVAKAIDWLQGNAQHKDPASSKTPEEAPRNKWLGLNRSSTSFTDFLRTMLPTIALAVYRH